MSFYQIWSRLLHFYRDQLSTSVRQRAVEFHANAAWAEPAEPAQKPTAPLEPPLPEDALQRYGSMAWRHNGHLRIAAMSRDGKTLITFTDRSMAVWDMATGAWKQHVRGL